MISRKPSKVCIAIDTEFSLVKTPISAISDDGADSRASRRPVVSVSLVEGRWPFVYLRSISAKVNLLCFFWTQRTDVGAH
jgi:hypothetical protein